jgi:hypothetical protein
VKYSLKMCPVGILTTFEDLKGIELPEDIVLSGIL